MNTFTNKEWGDGSEKPSEFNRKEFLEALPRGLAEKFEKRRVFHNTLKKCNFDLWDNIF